MTRMTGTFKVLGWEEQSYDENGSARGRWTILPGTSTGDLQGISGEGYFDTTDDGATYTLEVSF